MSRGRQHTVREGTSERYWYTLAGYLALGGVGLLLLIVNTVQSGSAAVAGVGTGLLLVFLSIAGLIVYPALFKDSAYVRAVERWNPKWWKYIAFGIGVPFLGYLALSLGNITQTPATLGVILHALTAPSVAIHYLYKRHLYVGVP